MLLCAPDKQTQIPSQRRNVWFRGAKHANIKYLSVTCLWHSAFCGRTHQWCSVHPSSPDGSHTCPLGRLRGRCSVGDSPSAHILVLSSLPRTDTHRRCRIHGDHSPPRIPLLSEKSQGDVSLLWRAALFFLHFAHNRFVLGDTSTSALLVILACNMFNCHDFP